MQPSCDAQRDDLGEIYAISLAMRDGGQDTAISSKFLEQWVSQAQRAAYAAFVSASTPAIRAVCASDLRGGFVRLLPPLVSPSETTVWFGHTL